MKTKWNRHPSNNKLTLPVWKSRSVCKVNFYTFFSKPALVAQQVEWPLWGMGGHEFDPGPWHTRVVKNTTSCSSLGTQTYSVELGLVDPVSGLCDWVWYHVKCLGHDTLLRQHDKSEHPVTTWHHSVIRAAYRDLGGDTIRFAIRV